jgi:hemin uptake protein HemP
MTTEVIEQGECDAEELLDRIENGTRIVVRTTAFGGEHDVALRYDGETYYCDTPTRLHKHTDPDEMLQCIRKHGYCEA